MGSKVEQYDEFQLIFQSSVSASRECYVCTCAFRFIYLFIASNQRRIDELEIAPSGNRTYLERDEISLQQRRQHLARA